MARSETDKPPIKVVLTVSKTSTGYLTVLIDHAVTHDRVLTMRTPASAFATVLKSRGIGLTSAPYRDAYGLHVNALLAANWGGDA